MTTKIYQLLFPIYSQHVNDNAIWLADIFIPNNMLMNIKNRTATSKFMSVVSILLLGKELMYVCPFCLMDSVTPYPE
jgi:hypothetical protein